MKKSTAEDLITLLRNKGIYLCTVESCTGGLLSAEITGVSGCSDVFLQGLVTYSNESKRVRLGVAAETLHMEGAVSYQVASQMALNCARQGFLLQQCPCLALATTGVAGPNHSEHKPLGLVYIAVALARSEEDTGCVEYAQLLLDGERHEIREQTVQEILSFALNYLEKHSSEALR